MVSKCKLESKSGGLNLLRTRQNLNVPQRLWWKLKLYHLCMHFRSSKVNTACWKMPGSTPASSLICSMISVPHIWNTAKKTSHHSMDKGRSRMLALNTDWLPTGTQKMPVSLSSTLTMRKNKNKVICKDKKFGDPWTSKCYELCFLILVCQDLNFGRCDLDDKQHSTWHSGVLRNRPGNVNECCIHICVYIFLFKTLAVFCWMQHCKNRVMVYHTNNSIK